MEYGQTAPAAAEPYPLTYSVDYPDRELNRLTTFFRLFTVIPIAIVLGAVSAGPTPATGAAPTTRAAPSPPPAASSSSQRC